MADITFSSTVKGVIYLMATMPKMTPEARMYAFLLKDGSSCLGYAILMGMVETFYRIGIEHNPSNTLTETIQKIEADEILGWCSMGELEFSPFEWETP